MAPTKPTITPRRPGERRVDPTPPPPLTPEQLAFIERGEAPAGHPPGTQEAPARHSAGTRRAPGDAAMVQRKRGALRRLNTYLRPDTFEALAAYCALEGEDMARVIDRAVREHLRQKGAME